MPDVFNNLTFAEEALIARIQVAAAAKKLKFGDRSLSGHVSFFDRTANVTEVATVLPNLAANLQILEFTKQVGRAANHTFRDFRVRRHAVQAALLWLCTHSPAYIGITVDQARIDALPVDGQIQAQVIEVQGDLEDVDLGPAAAQRDPAGLANNTRGIVKAILYPSGGYDPLDTTQCPILVVEFPGYTGPPWDPDHPTWVPIVSVEKRCDHGCCSRRGLPLWPGKAGSIHSLQGLTAGDGKLFDRIILHWDSKAEGKWPGIFYVGSSRAMAEHNLALAHPLSSEDLKKITGGGAWLAQKITVSKLERKARDVRQALAQRNDRAWHRSHPWGSKYDFAQRLYRFIQTHGPSIAAADSLPQSTKDEAASALRQWNQSLIDLGYTSAH